MPLVQNINLRLLQKKILYHLGEKMRDRENSRKPRVILTYRMYSRYGVDISRHDSEYLECDLCDNVQDAILVLLESYELARWSLGRYLYILRDEQEASHPGRRNT